MAVEHSYQTKQLPLLVVKGKGPNLLGRDWLRTLKLDWSCIHRLKGEEHLLGLLNKYTDVFAPG